MDNREIQNEKRNMERQAMRLREIRNRLELTQDYFSASIGISLDAYKKSEAAINTISIKLLNALKVKYNVSADWILFGEEKNKDSIWFDIQNCGRIEQIELFMRLYFLLKGENAVDINLNDDFRKMCEGYLRESNEALKEDSEE